MTREECFVFHENWKFMWEKLSATYYDVKNDTEKARRIAGKYDLPAYSICSKCHSDPDYMPSKRTIDSVVLFYNKNLSPEVSSYQFVHEFLFESNEMRHRLSTLYDRRFTGCYYGYYSSSSSSGVINGACLKIYEEGPMLKATMITGIRSDRQMLDTSLHELLAMENLTELDFKKYHESLPLEERRCVLYEGTVESTSSSLLVVFRSQDKESRKLILTVNIECFPGHTGRLYLGGLVFALATSDGPFDTRFYQMGLVRTDVGFAPLAMPKIKELLHLENTEFEYLLTSRNDRTWYEFILSIPRLSEEFKE